MSNITPEEIWITQAWGNVTSHGGKITTSFKTAAL